MSVLGQIRPLSFSVLVCPSGLDPPSSLRLSLPPWVYRTPSPASHPSSTFYKPLPPLAPSFHRRLRVVTQTQTCWLDTSREQSLRLVPRTLSLLHQSIYIVYTRYNVLSLQCLVLLSLLYPPISPKKYYLRVNNFG